MQDRHGMSQWLDRLRGRHPTTGDTIGKVDNSEVRRDPASSDRWIADHCFC